MDLWHGLTLGRIRDPAVEPYRPHVRFDNRRLSDPKGWRNGLIYSSWQFLAIPDLVPLLASGRMTGPIGRRRRLLSRLDDAARETFKDRRRWVLVLMALEARYLPQLDPEWLHLINTELERWDDYRALFDPVATAAALEVTADEIYREAERLLFRASRLDPMGEWSHLVRRAPRKTWRSLTDNALMALEHRMAAEVLLLFYEDLAVREKAEPLPTTGRVWHPLAERLSARRAEPIDQLLARLGVSPHPGVVLAVEGETEELLVPRVFDQLSLRRTPDLVRILCIRGADKQLALVAAATIAPLVGQRHDDGYDLIRPPTRLLIAVDHDPKWASDEQVARQRRNIIDEVKKVVVAQGAALSDDDLETLVHVRQWPGRCFEYAHFTDVELATAMMQVHPTCGGLTGSALIDRIAAVRARGGDIKDVWDQTWLPTKPKKPVVADALWPILERNIDDARWRESIEIPMVAQVVHEAYTLAQEVTYGTYVIRAADEN
jgi:hypothetical protein